MIPILYDKGETDFTSNGLGRLADCISCAVTEERNGIYECQFTYPVSGEMYSQIQEGRIVGVIHDDVHDIQPFDIYSRSAPLNGVVTFYAHHISYRLGTIILKPVSASTCASALAAIPNNTYTECLFTFWTDKSASGNWKTDVPSAVKAILGGQEGSILDVFGAGEYEWDKWTVKLYASRGNDNGVAIRYGVNLTDLTHDIDISGAHTGAVPYWKSPEGNTVVLLDEGYVQVSVPELVPWTDNNGNEIVDNQGRVIYANVESSAALLKMTAMDLSDAFEEQPSQAQLRAEALRRLSNSEAWLPSENIKVSFIDLAHTEEYKDVAALQRVKLCDRVSVYCGPLGVSAVSMQVIRVVFNVLTERYDEIELGKAKASFAQAITADVEHMVEDKASVSMMQKAINNATDMITGAKGGHVRFVYDANGDPQEILIMDTDDIETAVNVWRWNSGGLGFSSNGYAGPYGTAITQDGEIVADFITAGAINAGLITVGNLIADIIKGGTLTLGGSDNTNGILIVKDSNNNTVGTWSNTGLELNKGSINLSNNFIVDTNGDATTKSLTATDYVYVNGGSDSYLKIPTNNQDTTYYVEIANGGTKFVGIEDTTVIASGYGVNPYRERQISITKNSDSNVFCKIGSSGMFTKASGSASASYSNGYLQIYADNGKYLQFSRTDSFRQFELTANASFSGNLSVSGTKSRAVSTDQYSDRLLYCYETPSPMFGDVGEGTISEDGICYVWLDPVFAQTISTDQYQVFLQRYGPGDCYVQERRGACFVVAGTPGLSFGWEIKAKQGDFDQLRLEKHNDKFTPPVATYGEDAAAHINDIRKDREAA